MWKNDHFHAQCRSQIPESMGYTYTRNKVNIVRKKALVSSQQWYFRRREDFIYVLCMLDTAIVYTYSTHI